MSNKFELGKMYMTAGVAAKVKESAEFARFVNDSINRYTSCDWGDTCQSDWKLNDSAIASEGRILAVYKKEDSPTIWIITEWDREYTTILFPSEY